MAGLLNAAQLTYVQAIATSALDQTCIIKHIIKTKDAFGTEAESYSAGTSSACGFRQPSAGQLQMYAARLGSLATFHVAFPSGTDVQLLDHLVIGTDTLVVQVLLTPQSYSVTSNVLATEMK
jgi:hypothetical protein